MEIIEPGVTFQVANFGKTSVQTLTFTQRLPSGEFNEGTTNEEVLSVLIERFYHFQGVSSCNENSLILYHLKQARILLARRRDRVTKSKSLRNAVENDSNSAGSGT